VQRDTDRPCVTRGRGQREEERERERVADQWTVNCPATSEQERERTEFECDLNKRSVLTRKLGMFCSN
jgi:hypothetical protein